MKLLATQTESVGPPTQLGLRAVIVTSASESFTQYFAEWGDTGVMVADNVSAALAVILERQPVFVFADFRPLKDGWSGIRLVRELRRHERQGRCLWLMAEGLDSQLQSLIVDAGATGLLRRTPRAVAKILDGAQTVAHGVAGDHEPAIAPDALQHLVRAFRATAGPLASMHLTEVLGTDGATGANGGKGDGLRGGLPGVVRRLSDRLVLPAARESFLAQIASCAALRHVCTMARAGS